MVTTDRKQTSTLQDTRATLWSPPYHRRYMESTRNPSTTRTRGVTTPPPPPPRALSTRVYRMTRRVGRRKNKTGNKLSWKNKTPYTANN